MRTKYFGVSSARGVAVFAVSAAVGSAVACGSSFGTDCSATRTCTAEGGQESAAGHTASGAAGQSGVAATSEGGVPTGGAGNSGLGATGMAGAAGAAGGVPAQVECTTAKDCDDRKQCTGVETCVDGACVAGTPPCKNPDEANCTATCTEGAAKPTCSVMANDKDQDGHGSALCTAAPGDDCDDTEKTVYTGAPEICDRLDNDCNDLIDLYDGLPFSGSYENLGDASSTQRYASDVAWSEEAHVFGVVWRDDKPNDTPTVMFTAIAPDGKIKATARAINESAPIPLTPINVPKYRPRIAAGNGGFAVVWPTANAIGFRLVPATGVLTTPVKTIPTSSLARPDIAFSGAASAWGIAWGDRMATVNAGGLASQEKTVLAGSVDLVRIAAVGDGFGVARGPIVVLVAADLSGPKSIVIEGTNPELPAIGSASDHFGVVARPAPGAPAGSDSTFTAYDAKGNKLCGPVAAAAPGLLITDVVPTARGYTLSFDFRYGFQEIGLDCKVGPLLVKDTGVDTNYLTAFDGGGSGGYLVTALNAATDMPEYRLFGSNFCD